MISLRHFLTASPLLLALLATDQATATNPATLPPPPPRRTCPCDVGVDKSFEWSIEVGLARFTKINEFTSYAQVVSEPDGNLPNFAELYDRGFSQDPLQESQVVLELSQPQFGAATFHPSCLYVHSEASNELLKKPAASGFPEFIHQVLTNDRFTLIDLLPAPESGWRLRVWKRDAIAPALLTKSGGFYITTGFESLPPLKDVIFKRPTGTTGNNTLLLQFKEASGVAGVRSVTAERVQTVDSFGKALSLTFKLFSGEGTSGPLLSQENLTYSERGAKAWDYTITREVFASSLDAAGTIGPLVLTAKTREDYDDFSLTSGEPGMKRLVSKTEAYDVPGQSPQTTTFTYVQSPIIPGHQELQGSGANTASFWVPPSLENPAIHGRLRSSLKLDGSWTYNEYAISSSSPVSIIIEYTGWKDHTMAQRVNARKTITRVSANESIAESYVAGQLVSKHRNTTTLGAAERINTDEKWDGNAWHVTTTSYHSDNAAAPNTGRIKLIENSDGTASTYTYATINGELVSTTRTGAGSRSGITGGTEIKITYGIGNFPVAQITRDIASNLVTEQWDADLTYNGGFDQMGRPIKRIYNGDVNDYDISQYACCGLEYTRDRMGASTTYSRDGLKRVYKVETKASPASPNVTTFTTGNGLTTTRTRRFGTSDALFLGSVTRSMDGLTTKETGPARKSSLAIDRPVTTRIVVRSSTGDTATTTYADGSTSISAAYLDGRIKSNSGSAVPDNTHDYSTHNENGGGETTIITASGMVTSMFSDLLGRASKTVSGATGTTTYTYHPPTATPGSRGMLQSTTDADGVAITYGYDAEGERTTESRSIPIATGTATRVTTTLRDVIADVVLQGVSLGVCHRQSRSVSSTGVSAIITTSSYAAIDGLVSGTDVFGNQTLTVRTRANATSGAATRTMTNPDETKTVQTITHGLLTGYQSQTATGSVITGISYTHDAFQRPDAMTDLRTGATTFSDFTEAGQSLTSTTNGGSDVTTSENDIMGRSIRTILPDTSVKHTAYHPTGQAKVTWGSQTYPTWNVYDEQGRQIQLHTWKSAPTLDPVSIPFNPPSGSEVTTWIFGATTGRLSRKEYADTKGTDYSYTAAGRLQTRVWARGITTTYGYTHGLMTSTDYSDSTPDVTLIYDSLGRQSTVTQTNQSQITYTYDPANLALDTETIQYDLDHDGSYEFTRVLDRSRDTLNRESGWLLKDGSTLENQATYGYSATDGRLGTVTGGGDITSPQTFTYGYVPDSNLLQTVTGPIHTVTNTWEPNRDVLDIKENKVGTELISSFDYAVNSIGQRTGVTTSGTAFPNVPAWLWGYDNLGQVITADSSVNTSDRAYQYDAIGNRKKSSDSLTLPTTDNYTSNTLNQYAVVQIGGTGVSPVHDDDGNATAYPLPVASTTNSTLVWDAANRQISSTVGSVTTTYLYDAQSRRIAKTTGANTTVYLYDAWNCIAEYVGTALSKTRLWGTDLSGSLQGAGGVGGLLAVRAGSVSHFPTYDGNGNVSEYLAANGTLSAHFEYDTFGNTVVNTDTTGQFEYRFSTKPRDSETGLYYYAYRYYDPLTGRWPSRDPIEEMGGENLYLSNFNDPLSWFDYLGREPIYSNSPELAAAHQAGVNAIKRERESFLKDRNDARSNSTQSFGSNGAAEAGGRVCRKCDKGEVTYYTTETTGKRSTPGTDQHVNPEDAPKCTELDTEVRKWHTHPGFVNGDEFSADPEFSTGDKRVTDTKFENTDPKTGEKKTYHHPQNRNGVPFTLTSETERGSNEFVTKSYQYGIEETYKP